MRNRATNRMNVSNQYSFARLPAVSMPRSTFDRSHGLKTTLNESGLFPILVDEALPGDTIQCAMTGFLRLSTPLVPIMDNLRADVFFFAIPLRLVWDNFQKFMGEQENPGDSTDYLVPIIDNTSGILSYPGTLWDYMGLPVIETGATNLPENISALPFRAYNLVWREWFRDENLQDSPTVNKDDGPDDYAAYTYGTQYILRRGKRKDYITGCLPWPQKGTAVDLPLGTSAPVTLDSQSGFAAVGDGTAAEWRKSGGSPSSGLLLQGPGSTTATWNSSFTGDAAFVDPHITTDISGALGTADLSSATAATINQIREAFQIQRLYERDARGGTRYTEILLSHFGVTSDDARLQRPEYLGGGSIDINIQAVPQTSQTGTTPQGNLAAFGVGAGQTPHWIKSFTEHCIILGLINVRADLNYQQNIDRMWTRQTRWDFYWPSLAHLGEQAVLNQEVFYNDDTLNQDVWGYQERWAEYRYKPSKITGKMRSDVGTTYTESVDIWHLAQDFDGARPNLNDSFIQDRPPLARATAVTSEPHFYMDAFFNYRCTRPMPMFSVPGLIDHF